MKNRSGSLAVLALLALCLASPAAFAARAGELLFIVGDVQIERMGLRNTAFRGAPIEVGDTVHTGADGRTQIMMSDGALIFLRPGSSFLIEAMTMPSNQAAAPAMAQAPVQPREQTPGRVVMSLLRGGLRTISGLIGKRAGEEYRLKTPVATIGIRGTDYTAVYCSANCVGAKDGLHVSVSKGAIAITNNGGQIDLYNGQYAYVGTEQQAPERTTAPSPALKDTLPSGEDDGSEGDGGDGSGYTPPATGTESSSAQGGSPESVPPVPEEELIPLDPRERSYAFTAGDAANVDRDSISTLTLDDAGALTRFRGSVPAGGAGEYAIGAASTHDLGYDPVTGIGWGRWHGGQATAGGHPLDLSEASLHWISGPQYESFAALPITGSVRYELVGNTNPTDASGNVGVLGSASLTADFSNQLVSSNLALTMNTQLWTAAGSAPIVAGTPLFAGNYSSVTVDGSSAGTSGGFAGFFSPPAHDGATPVGAGISYALSNGNNTVNGAAAFGNPVAQGQNSLTGPGN